MDGRRAPQGLDAEDRIAFGLTAPHLFYLVIFSMTGWGFLSSHLPLVVRLPPGVVLLFGGAILAWGRVAGRPVDRWLLLYGTYRLRPRRSVAPATVVVPAGMVTIPGAAVLQLRRAPSARGPRARRVAFFSMCGGTGKSTLAAETAIGLAAGAWRSEPGDSPTRVALLDLDTRASSMAIRLGLDGPTLDDLLATRGLDEAAFERSLLRHESGARVLLGPAHAVQHPGAQAVVAPLLAHIDDREFDVVVIDLASGTGDLNRDVLEVVDAIYYVFATTPTGVHDLYRGVAALRRLGLRDKICLVENRAHGTGDLTEILGDLRVTVTASIPLARALADAELLHRPAVLDSEKSQQFLWPLAESVFPDLWALETGFLAAAGGGNL